MTLSELDRLISEAVKEDTTEKVIAGLQAVSDKLKVSPLENDGVD